MGSIRSTSSRRRVRTPGIGHLHGLLAVVLCSLAATVAWLGLEAPHPAAGATVIDGCTVVAKPSTHHVTRCGGRTLSGTDFAGADLPRADFSGTDLAGASFTGSNLAGANLAGADLSHADLASANLAGADLSHADLAFTSLAGTDLAGANLSHANLASANLAGADLSGVSSAGITGAPRALPLHWKRRGGSLVRT